MTKPEKVACQNPKEICAQNRKSSLTKHTAAEQRLYEGDPGACLLRRALWLDGAVSRARPDLGAEEACALYGFTLAAREEAAEAVSAAGEGV